MPEIITQWRARMTMGWLQWLISSSGRGSWDLVSHALCRWLSSSVLWGSLNKPSGTEGAEGREVQPCAEPCWDILSCLHPFSVLLLFQQKGEENHDFPSRVFKARGKISRRWEEGRFWLKKGVGEKLKASGLLCMQRNQVRSGGAQSERKLAAQLLWKRRRGQLSSTPCSI